MPRPSNKTARERLVVQRDRMERELTKLLKEGQINNYATLVKTYKDFVLSVDSMPDVKSSKATQAEDKVQSMLMSDHQEEEPQTIPEDMSLMSETESLMSDILNDIEEGDES